LFAHERQHQIMELLHEHRSVKVADLIKKFQVSIETVRRDLEYLEREGMLKRVHGGAVLEEINSRELSFMDRQNKHLEAKKELAEYAARYIIEGQSIALDVSTTNTEFAKVLAKKFEKLTVLTNSLPIVQELASKSNFTILLAGGIVRNQEMCVVGDMAEAFISQFHIDTFFMSMSGISLTNGLTDYGIGEVQIKQRMLKSAQKAIVLADSSKFDVISLLKVCDFNQVDKIITDSRINPKIMDKYLNQGIEVINQ